MTEQEIFKLISKRIYLAIEKERWKLGKKDANFTLEMAQELDQIEAKLQKENKLEDLEIKFGKVKL